MAERDVTIVEGGNGVMIARWADLDNGDTGEPVALAGWPVKTVQLVGGTTASLEGSNDGGTTWAPLHETDGTAITAAATGAMYELLENPLLIRVNTVVGANMSITISATRR
jgi:hypothetical protein